MHLFYVCNLIKIGGKRERESRLLTMEGHTDGGGGSGDGGMGEVGDGN